MSLMILRQFAVMITLIIGLALASPVRAQSGDVPQTVPESVTLDDVNRVASGMYCPECENIPLDKCGTQVCVQWKNEIAVLLSQGVSDQEIIDGFVSRFGDRVVSVPQDPTLRALSLTAPWILAGLVLLSGLWVLARLWRRPQDSPLRAAPQVAVDDDYRAQLERDLRE